MNEEITQDDFEVDIALEEARKLTKKDKNITFKCKGSKQGRLNFFYPLLLLIYIYF